MRHLVIASVLAVSLPASAFCGFYVSSAGGNLFNDATMVTLMRDGTRTVLGMQNNYRGPPEDFALVIPVPVILQKENVKTLPKGVFERMDALASPRLVDEDAPHGDGGGTEEVAAPVPGHARLVDQAQVGFVDQGARLEQVAGTFLAQHARGNRPHLRVDLRDEFVEGLGLPAMPAVQQLGDVGHRHDGKPPPMDFPGSCATWIEPDSARSPRCRRPSKR